MVTKLGYARVSSHNQRTDNQRAALEAAGCVELFVDEAVSGANNHQGVTFADLFFRVRELRAEGKEVVVCVTKLDRFSRSLRNLLEGIEELGKLGAPFTALSDSFTYDAQSPMSKLMLQMLGALSEFERSLITSRMSEGMEAKVAKGLRRGQKPRLTAAAVGAIRASHAAEPQSPARLAKEWGVSRSTVIRVLGLYGSDQPYISLDEWEAAKEQAHA